MAAVPPQPSEADGPFDMNYYLTEGLEEEEHQRYRGVDSFRKAINLRTEELQSGNADEYPTPYLIFSHVLQQHLATIKRVRDSDYKRLRFLYLQSPTALIVKIMPGKAHEGATREFEKAFDRKLVAVGLGNVLKSMGSAMYQATENESQKEADASFKPYVARHRKEDWPTMVLECGVSESPRRLKADAHWWADNSAVEVKIVLVLIVSEMARTIRIQYWETHTVPNLHITRTCPEPTITRATIENTIHIDRDAVNTITKKGEVVRGGTLSLDFKRMFLRDPVEDEGEANIALTEHDLRSFYDMAWKGMD